MEVQILEKQDGFVRVKSTIGSFYGTWCSSTPIVTKKYIVEIDSDAVLTRDDVELSNCNRPSIEGTKGITYIVGLVEEIENDTIVLRLQSTIMMLETLPNLDFTQYLGRYVKISISDVVLYDVGIC